MELSTIMNIRNYVDVDNFTHLFIFGALGILFPNNYIGAILLSLVWDLFEGCLTKKTISKQIVIDYFNSWRSLWDESKGTKLVVLIINMIGYTIGSFLRNRFII